jgi:uncharacterized protein DUF3859
MRLPVRTALGACGRSTAMLAITLLALLVLLAPNPGRAKDPARLRIDLVEYGIYSVSKTNCHRDEQSIERCDRGDIRHVSTTWTIPARHEVEFGLKYRVTGAPGGKLTLKRLWLLPGSGFLPPGKEPIKQLVRFDTVSTGGIVLASYGFDDPWELVPGPWTLEIWDDDKKLFSQTFNVVVQEKE